MCNDRDYDEPMRKDVHKKPARQGTNNRVREQRLTKWVTMLRPVEGEKGWEIRLNKRHIDEIGCRRRPNVWERESWDPWVRPVEGVENDHDAWWAQGNEHDARWAHDVRCAMSMRNWVWQAMENHRWGKYEITNRGRYLQAEKMSKYLWKSFICSNKSKWPNIWGRGQDSAAVRRVLPDEKPEKRKQNKQMSILQWEREYEIRDLRNERTDKEWATARWDKNTG